MSYDRFYRPTKYTFDKKCHLTEKNCAKVRLSKIHLTESSFDQMSFLSNDLSVKWPFCQMTFLSNDLLVHFSEKAFGYMNFRSYVILVIWLVFQVRFSVKWPFSKYFQTNDLLINFVFSQMTFFGKINFRSNGLRLTAIRSNVLSVKWHSVKRCSVKWCFGQTAFRSKIFGEMIFR
jgi:hypothetical protein